MQKEVRGGSVTFKRSFYDSTKRRTFASILATVSLEEHAVPIDIRHKFKPEELTEADDYLRSDEARDVLAMHLRAKDDRKKVPPRKKSKMVTTVTEEDGDSAYDAFHTALNALVRAIDSGYRPEYRIGVRSNVGAICHALSIADLNHFHSLEWKDSVGMKDLKADLDTEAVRDALKLPQKVIEEICRTWGTSHHTSCTWRYHEMFVADVVAGHLPMPKGAKVGFEDHCKRRLSSWIAANVELFTNDFVSPEMPQAHKDKLKLIVNAGFRVALNELEGYVPGGEALKDFAHYAVEGQTEIEEEEEFPFGPSLAESRAINEWAEPIYIQRARYIRAHAEGTWEPTIGGKECFTVAADYAAWCKSQGLEVL